MEHFSFEYKTKSKVETIYTVIYAVNVSGFASIIAYIIRWILCGSFMYQCQAEQAANSMANLLNNLPDAVLVLKPI